MTNSSTQFNPPTAQVIHTVLGVAWRSPAVTMQHWHWSTGWDVFLLHVFSSFTQALSCSYILMPTHSYVQNKDIQKSQPSLFLLFWNGNPSSLFANISHKCRTLTAFKECSPTTDIVYKHNDFRKRLFLHCLGCYGDKTPNDTKMFSRLLQNFFLS